MTKAGPVFRNALVALIFCIGIVLAQESSSDANKLRQHAKKAPNNLLEVNGSNEFEKIINYPRDYSVSLLLTAVNSPPVQCMPCKAFQPTYENIANGFRKSVKGEAQDRHIFAFLEFNKGREVFQKLKLEYAPVLLFFPPTVGPRAPPSPEPQQYDFNSLGFEGEDLAADLSKRLGVKVPFSKPFPWEKAGAGAGVASLIAVLMFFVFPRISRAIAGGEADSLFRPKAIIGFIVRIAILATITVMCAGHMFNGIRHTPYVTADGSGKPQYFASGFQNQNSAETQIVAIICEYSFPFAFLCTLSSRLLIETDSLLAFSVVSMAVLVPMQRDPVKQRAGVYVWSAIMLSAFSLLLYIFRLKNPSYPFRLFF